MILESPFYLNRLRNYPLYRYNPDLSNYPFSDSKMIYVYANYFSVIRQEDEQVILVYDPSKSAASLLANEFKLDGLNQIVVVKGSQSKLSLTMSLGTEVLVTLINIQPSLTGQLRFDKRQKSSNQKEKEKNFEINVSFSNENSNRVLVSTLNIAINLQDYNIFLFNEAVRNRSFLLNLSEVSSSSIILNQSLFKGPVEFYSLEVLEEKTKEYKIILLDYLRSGLVLAGYKDSLFFYGLVLDMVQQDNYIFVLSQYKLFVYDKNNFPKVHFKENFDVKKNNCSITHHSVSKKFLFNCNQEFKMFLYEYTNLNDQFLVNKTEIGIPYSLGVIKK